MGKLTELKVKNAKPAEKIYKLNDGEGLYLVVKPTGYKVWRFRYTLNGIKKEITIGPYPVISLTDARKRALELKKLVLEGIDPQIEKIERKLLKYPTFKELALDFIERKRQNWHPTCYKNALYRLERYVFPHLGSFPINEIKPLIILNLLRGIEKLGKLETLKRVKILISQIFRYAVACGYEVQDPTPSLRGILLPPKVKHMAAITDPKKLKGLLKAIWDYPHSPIIKIALRFAVYLFPRPNELVSMRWEDIDFERAEWRFILSKTGKEHIKPLPKQVITQLKEIKIITGKSPYVFPSLRDFNRHISVEALSAALRRLGISKEEQTIHGFRATARTILHEVLGWAPDIIEISLGHKVPDRLGEAYARTKFLPQRKMMMQMWADYIDALREDKEKKFLDSLKTRYKIEHNIYSNWLNPL
jgi:integrase